jgi:2-(3-amino-3-carboxypropyl)histidine synthase
METIDNCKNGNQECCLGSKVLSEAPKKRFVGVKNRQGGTVVVKRGEQKTFNSIPPEILENQELKDCIALLPLNYNFEIMKSVWQIQKHNATKVALQFPEGLLMYSLTISDILERFCKVETLVMGDVTYGACCIDDFTALAVGCDFMIHYGHSCLIPVDITRIKTLYVFVDISFDIQHFVDIIKHNFDPSQKIALVATIQFVSSLSLIVEKLPEYVFHVPQSRPLSRGEILGCTAPKLTGQDVFM